METFNLTHAKVLYLRFCAIYDSKFVKPFHDEDFKALWEYEWTGGLAGIDPNVIKDSLAYCRKNLEWPPSIAEFIKICESFSGVPSLEESINCAIRREFSHPVILMSYEKVGSWSMKNDSAKELKPKFHIAYTNSLHKFRTDSENSWKQLELYNSKPKELPHPDKIPTQSERKGFRTRMSEYYQKLEELKVNVNGKTYKAFDENAIKKNHQGFSQQVYNQYRDYLLSLPDPELMILPPGYMYDRMKFIGQLEQPEILRNLAYVPPNERDKFHEHASRNGKTKNYKNWNEG